MPEDEGVILRPMQYPIDVVIGEPGIPTQVGATGRGSVALTDRVFSFQLITHQIVEDGRAPALPVQDGLYRIDWSVYEQTRFYKGAVPMADAAHGSVRAGHWIPLRAPVTVDGNETLHVKVINEFGPRPAPFTVHIIFHGVERVDPTKAS